MRKSEERSEGEASEEMRTGHSRAPSLETTIESGISSLGRSPSARVKRRKSFMQRRRHLEKVIGSKSQRTFRQLPSSSLESSRLPTHYMSSASPRVASERHSTSGLTEQDLVISLPVPSFLMFPSPVSMEVPQRCLLTRGPRVL